METTERIIVGRLRKQTSELDEAIKHVMQEMEIDTPDSEKYKQQLSTLERLIRLRSEERKDGINPNTVAVVAGNLLGILIIVAYEQKHVMVSKGLGFVLRTNTPSD